MRQTSQQQQQQQPLPSVCCRHTLLLALLLALVLVSEVASFSTANSNSNNSNNAQNRLHNRLARINQQAKQFPAAPAQSTAPATAPTSKNTPAAAAAAAAAAVPSSTTAPAPAQQPVAPSRFASSSRYAFVPSMQEAVEARRPPANQVPAMVNTVRKNRASMKSARQWPFAMATSGEQAETITNSNSSPLQPSPSTGITLQRGRPTGSPTFERAMLPFAGYVDEGGSEVFILQPAYHELKPLLLSEQWDKATSFQRRL